MSTRRGRKRKTSGPCSIPTNSTSAPISPEDRASWQGWVEMESEPAFFNVMLKEMGVSGIKTQEIYSMDEDMLAILPHPVHALIFLFRYRDGDEQGKDQGVEAEHIWFANQIPDFACATVALLNIVNNIPDLKMGKELRDFKDFSKDMDSLSRGDMIDQFDFVKRIHNSFARDNDILQANVHLKTKMEKAKRKAAAAKGQATREAKKISKMTIDAEASSESVERPKTTLDGLKKEFHRHDDVDYVETKHGRTNGADRKDGTCGQEEEKNSRRRSTRVPKPRKELQEVEAETELKIAEEGFHFIAYMPVGDHVWKLDGLDQHPTDMGSFGKGGNGADGGTGNWIDAVSPVLLSRFEQFAGAEIEFNLMAVVPDPAAKERTDLLLNIKTMQAIDAKIAATAEDWRTRDNVNGEEATAETLTGSSITQADLNTVELPEATAKKVADDCDVQGLLEMRNVVLSQQRVLRAGLRDASVANVDDDEKARHRRHDYCTFVRTWLRALAENEILGDLVELGSVGT